MSHGSSKEMSGDGQEWRYDYDTNFEISLA